MWRNIATMICGWCEQMQPGGAGGVYTLVFATLCCQDTVRIMPYSFSMSDETVATRPPWLDSSLPRFHAGAFLVFLGIIQQYLSSSAMRSHESVHAASATGMHLFTPCYFRHIKLNIKRQNTKKQKGRI